MVHLAPADLRKEGAGYDLAIAVGILIASGQLAPAVTEETVFLGELALDAALRHVHGALSVAAAAVEMGARRLIVPAIDAPEAALIDGLEVIGIESLGDLLRATPLMRLSPFDRDSAPPVDAEAPWGLTDFSDVRGQEHVKRALEVAASGGHNLLMTGPPGAGKTLLARSMPGILPPMANLEALAVTKIYSVSGTLREGVSLIRQRPFRAPHHTISNAGLVGGGRQPRPGEISLSHYGVLFLDELPEFNVAALEALRQPLEDREITIARAQGAVTYPADFTLIAAMNPCPCGNFGDSVAACTCASGAVMRYQRRISGPLMDRIDLFVEVPRVDYEKLASTTSPESSEIVRTRVAGARRIQVQRFGVDGPPNNAGMTPRLVREFCQERLRDDAGSLLKMAMNQLSLSARSFHRVLRVLLGHPTGHQPHPSGGRWSSREESNLRA